MPKLEMDTVAGRISLDEQETTGYGFQILSGLTGMGLPNVDTNWLESAADGATFRSSRTKHRDVDLVLNLYAQNRAGLKSLVDKFSLALSGPITLRWVDGSEVWTLACHRVGGGAVTYGKDTTGDDELTTVVTLRAGDPYWSRTTSSSIALAPIGNQSVTNPGTAPAQPLWRLTGPLTSFQATSPSGKQRISWSGDLAAGQTLLIDARTGTAKSNGANRYHELGVAPKFWTLPPGVSHPNVTFTGEGDVTVVIYPRSWMVI